MSDIVKCVLTRELPAGEKTKMMAIENAGIYYRAASGDIKVKAAILNQNDFIT
jgi:hypothetical protein